MWRGLYYVCGVPFVWLVSMMTIRQVFRFSRYATSNPVENVLRYVTEDATGFVVGGVVLGVSLLVLHRLEPMLLRTENRKEN